MTAPSKSLRVIALVGMTFSVFFGSTIVLTRLFFRPAHPVAPTADQIATSLQLINDLRDPDCMMRLAAICRLGDMGPFAERALPAIKEALRDAYVNESACCEMIAANGCEALRKITESDRLSDLWWKEFERERREAKAKAAADSSDKTDHANAELR